MTAVDDRNVGPARPRPRATIRPAARSTARPPYINRELSWLEYVDRVMFEARDRRNPLIERVRFLTIFASMLVGPERKTLFLLAAEWRGIEQVNEAVAARTGQVLISQAPVPGAGWP